MNTTIIGVDPGVVHTGCVALHLDTSALSIDVEYAVINGTDVNLVADFIDARQGPLFIEDYNPNNYTREDKKMSEALGRLKHVFAPMDDPIVRYVDNAGANTLIPHAVLQCFGVHRFPVATHHNDLVSAGKIALLGMLKEKNGELRELLSLVVKADLNGRPWKVIVHA